MCSDVRQSETIYDILVSLCKLALHLIEYSTRIQFRLTYLTLSLCQL
jgi:hypothetical protein